ncbi:MAG: GlcNAc-transferase family protein [Alphaproteobacteria bacterium]|nr:GlcNAc-transferase family protein [Alphaproteobacteria bacterium]
MTSNQPKIFVQIASYRDPECHRTICDLFDKATQPQRVFVGVCWQYDPDEDADFLSEPYPRAEQVRVAKFHCTDAKGAGWARMQAQALWHGEEYVLQIQAHHRFEPGWDETLIQLLLDCPSEKAVLTAWLPGYRPPDERETDAAWLPLAVVNRLGSGDDAQMVHLIKRMVPAEALAERLLPTPFWVGNFLFTRAGTMREVPFDPHIYFWGEELNYSARLWTHGYNLFHLNRRVLYHYWDRSEAKDAAMYRSFADVRNRRSLARNCHLLGLGTTTDKEALAELHHYGLGTVRSLKSFWDYAGIDLARGTIAPHARYGHWPQQDAGGQRLTPMIFVAIASHRDPEISATLADMFAKAAEPERLKVGICLQLEPDDGDECEVRSDRMRQIAVHRVAASDSKGANWARAEALKLRADEPYVLMIDSHMRFEPRWEETLISMLSRCPSPRPVISAYLPNYDPPDARDVRHQLLRIRARRFGQEGDPQLLHLTGRAVPPQDAEMGGLYPSPFIIANFMFAPASALDEVPVDPHFHFYGDELSYSARLWTHGWDVFQPDCRVAYHFWVRRDRLHLQHYRGIQSPPNQRARQRGLHLLGLSSSDQPEPLAELARYGLGLRRMLDDFWRFAGISWADKHITPDALEGRWNMAAKRQPKPPAARRRATAGNAGTNTARPRIFVQIASYRDPDCQHTVQQMYASAAYPERIFTGICWQFIAGEDDHCFTLSYPFPKQVRVKEVDARQSRGVCWARSQTQALWQGEEFTLQIDSHMRFEQGWDEALLHMWASCENDKAVLSCYPPGFTPPDDRQRKFIFGMSAKEFDKHGILLMKGAPAIPVDKLPERPMRGAFASGCMLFAPASIIRDVPYDPYLYFFGEEISYSVRLWTHGYDLFHPNQLCVYHDWDRSKRPTHFSDHRDWSKPNQLSFARVRHLLGTERSSDPKVLEEIERFGLGTVRTLAEYQAYAGVDFVAKNFTERSARGVFGEALGEAGSAPAAGDVAGQPRPRILVQIASYRDPECQWTVKDLFEKATYPDRITVAICWQYDPQEDGHCFEISTRPEQVKVLPFDWRESEGVCWARRQTQLLWEGEEYSLQIDSHMRFTPGWDEAMIAELAACDAAKPVLSCSPASYVPPNMLEQHPRPTVRRVLPFFADGNLRGRGEALHRTPEKPLRGAFIAAGFVFARSAIINDVPYDPYLYFDQEEITYAARLFTHGWDVFSTRRPLLYHYYNTGQQKRPMHWHDLREFDEAKIRALKSRGLARFNHLTGFRQASDLAVIKELAFYGFGRVRSLAEFEAFTGIDFKKKIASEKALRAEFIEGLANYREGRIFVPELDAPSDARPETRHAAPRSPAPPMRITALETDDFLPLFSMEDSNHVHHNLEVHGGRWGLLLYLPRQKMDYALAVLAQLHALLSAAPREDIWMLFVVDDTADNLAALVAKHRLPQVLIADPGRLIARALGIAGAEIATAAMPAVGYVVNRNLRIHRRLGGVAASELAQQLVRGLAEAVEAEQRVAADARVIRRQAPALIVPRVFSPDYCRQLIHVFRTGHTFEGTVGAEEKLAYVPHTKMRSDYVVHGELLRQIDDKLSRSLFPEIQKVFGFEVAHREFYKIGLYDGAKGGFFKPHRDNHDAPVGYRRVAMTLHLSDDYEGGGLHFPEYDHHVYRPELGSAIAFSCATMHEALPVTKGERFVLVGFFHGREDEAFRQFHRRSKSNPVKAEDFVPALRELPPQLELARSFYTRWQADKIPPATTPATTNDAAIKPAAPAIITTLGGHQPRKVLESDQAIIYDDFLPEDLYQRLYDFAVKTDYQYINTSGKVSRAWHVHDGFPLRSLMNLFYYPPGTQQPKGDFVYPTQTDMDQFIDHLLAMQPHIEHFVGAMGKDWSHVTATNWIYPHGTGLSLHDDGSGVYSGAYAYFLNPTWKLHWGGLNLMMGQEGSQLVQEHRSRHNQTDFYNRKWLNANNIDELLMEHGLAQCIFPKKNRIVFIAPSAYHMVTRVNEQCGDNLRMSIAGFYNRKK